MDRPLGGDAKTAAPQRGWARADRTVPAIPSTPGCSDPTNDPNIPTKKGMDTVVSTTPPSEPSSVVERFFNAWNSHDAHALGGVFPADGEFTTVLGHHAVGPDAIAELHVMPFARLFADAELSCTDVRTRYLGPGLASVDADWSMKGHTNPRGEPLPGREGSLHLIAARRDNRWQPLVAHNLDYGDTYTPMRHIPEETPSPAGRTRHHD